MPDVFDQIEATQRPKSTVMPTAPKAGGSDVFDQIEAQRGSSQTDSSATPQHGGLYQATNRVLNATTPTQDTGNPTLDKIANGINYAGDQVTGTAQGVLKGVLSTAAGAGSVYNRLTGSSQPFNQDNLKELTVGHGPGQTVGKGFEQVGEFATGEGAAAKALGTGGKIAASGGLSALQSGGDPLTTAIGTFLPAVMSQPVVKKVGQALARHLEMKSGAAEGAISRAFLNPDSNGMAKVLKGEYDATDVVKNIQNEVKAFRDSASTEYRAQLAKIKNTQIQNWPAKAGNFLKNTHDKLLGDLKDFSIIQDPNGAWNFRHFDGDVDQTKKLIETVYNWGSEGRDLTPIGLDNLKQQISSFEKQGGKLGALASRLNDQVTDNLNTIINGYSQMTSKYAASAKLLRQFRSELSIDPKGNVNPGTAARKLQYLFKESNKFKQDLVKTLPNSDDLLDQIAGITLKNVLPNGLLRPLLGSHGLLGASYLMSSPRLMAETARATGRVAQSPNTPVILNTARHAVQAGANNSNTLKRGILTQQ